MAYATDTWTTWTTNAATTATVDITASTWRYWVDTGTSTTTGTWAIWTNASTDVTTASITAPSYWVGWNEEVESKRLTKTERKAARKRQAEQEAAQRQRQQEWHRQQAAAEAKRKAAAERAEQLLLSHLSEEQEKAWKEERAIFVTSQSGKRYKIKAGRTHNLFELNERGEPVKELCVHVQPACPNADNVLAQKLALEHNETLLLEKANVWDLTRPERPMLRRAA